MVISQEDSLRRMFEQDGNAVEDVVLAWSGFYPFWDGNSNWGYFFTMRQCIVLREGRVEAWSTQSGRPATKLVGSVIEDVYFGHLRAAMKYQRVHVARRSLWIRTADAQRIKSWGSL